MRMQHEASLYEDNCFITLTYDPEHLPEDQSLNKRHFQLFMKRLRRAHPKTKIRFFHCGEYGDEKGRPHYHACLFNYDFADKIHCATYNGYPVYTSEHLSKLWGMGLTQVGSLTFQSAAYVARYICKKVKISQYTYDNYKPDYVEELQKKYNIIDENGEVLHEIEPEYATMSRNPGIGNAWFEKYKSDCYPSDGS